MTTYRIAPSILSADFARLGEEVRKVVAAGADWIHFDVMDNHYVPNLTIGPLVCEAIRPRAPSVPIDVHLMVKPVDRIIPDFAKAGANIITFHPEASEHVDRTLQLIRDRAARPVWCSIRPRRWTYLDHVMDKLDVVLLMSVNPGFGGQNFIAETLAKLRACARRSMPTSAAGAAFALRSTVASRSTTSPKIAAPAPTPSSPVRHLRRRQGPRPRSPPFDHRRDACRAGPVAVRPSCRAPLCDARGAVDLDGTMIDTARRPRRRGEPDAA